MAALMCKGCGYPLRPLADGFVIDLAHDRFDELRPELYGVARLDGRFYCPPDSYALKHTGHVPAEPASRSETPVGHCQLSADQWRVISYLYRPDQRISPNVAAVIQKQAVDRADVVEVVERGLVQTRIRGEECPHVLLTRLPEKAIRLRLTKAGCYRASHDPQHLVLRALRAGNPLNVLWLMRRLAQPVHFGQLCDLADRDLITTHWIETDIEVPMADLHACEAFAEARITKRGRTFVAYA